LKTYVHLDVHNYTQKNRHTKLDTYSLKHKIRHTYRHIQLETQN